jgi:hypothetical protein
MEVLDTATATASGGREVFACLPGALELIARQATLTVV